MPDRRTSKMDWQLMNLQSVEGTSPESASMLASCLRPSETIKGSKRIRKEQKLLLEQVFLKGLSLFNQALFQLKCPTLSLYKHSKENLINYQLNHWLEHHTVILERESLYGHWRSLFGVLLVCIWVERFHQRTQNNYVEQLLCRQWRYCISEMLLD